MGTSANNVTQLLAELGGGDGSAASRLLPLVYEELRAIARRFMSGKEANQTLQPTALVHEAYLRLVERSRADWTDRAHFMGVAAKAMRRLLIDHHRARQAQKRGGQHHRVTLDDSALAVTQSGIIDALSLEEALERLAALDERKARVVELRFFCGLTNDEVAHVLGVSRTTIADDWRFSRAWLAVDIEGEHHA